MKTVLLVEPYDTGSHGQWARGYANASAHDVVKLTMSGRFWKWRMHGAAVTMSRRLADLVREDIPERPDAVLASDMLDLATFLGLSRQRLHGAPSALYVHENQLSYPYPATEDHWTESRRRRAARRDEHYAFINLTSMLAADRVLWNSEHNRRSFVDALPAFLKRFPDYRETGVVADVEARSGMLPLGLDLQSFDGQRSVSRPSGRPRVLWNHRWEHDKAPEVFFEALQAAAGQGLDFSVVVLGESFGSVPPAFESARRELDDRIDHWGYVEDRNEYGTWLRSCDVVVSTAKHEFFGAAVAEAVFCGCLPVLPNALAYPEIVPQRHHDAVLYDSFDGLVEGLMRALRSPDETLRAALAEHMKRYDWTEIVSQYDDEIDDMVDRARTLE